MSELTCLSLFSGIGGLDLAAQQAGFRTVAFVENEPFCQRVLRKHWPDVPIFEDVKHVTAESLAAAGIHSVDLLHGGFPCQPHSVAGKRQAGADERDLWPEFVRIIRETNPRWILGENVPGLLSSDFGRFFGGILRDLAALGFDVGWCVYGAGDVGAPHRRDRVFIIGHHTLADAAKSGLSSRRQAGIKPQGEENAAGTFAGFERRRDVLADTPGDHLCHDDQPRPGGTNQERRGVLARGRSLQIGNRRGYNRWDGGSSQPGLGRGTDGLPSWLDGCWPARPDEPQYDWEPPRTATGIRDRAARLKALGNAVMPAQAYPILQAIADVEHNRVGVRDEHQAR